MQTSLLILLSLSFVSCGYRITPEETLRHVAQQGADLVVIGQALQQGANPSLWGGTVAAKGTAIVELVGYEVEQ